MKWHDYRPMVNDLAKEFNTTTRDLIETFNEAVNKPQREGGPNKLACQYTKAIIAIEYNWQLDKRPYYDVYPSVVEALTKVDLSKIKCEQVNAPIANLLVRFKVGHELIVGNEKVCSFITLCDESRGYKGIILIIDSGVRENGFICPSVHSIPFRKGEYIVDQFKLGSEIHKSARLESVTDETVHACLQMAVSLYLLNDNPDLIEPEPIEADRQKWEATHNPALIEKAARRGKRGWAVGKHIEVAPGFRRPHFAIRWMGQGTPKQPVLRPVKGCLVKRKKITDVPTGRLDDALEAILLDD